MKILEKLGIGRKKETLADIEEEIEKTKLELGGAQGGAEATSLKGSAQMGEKAHKRVLNLRDRLSFLEEKKRREQEKAGYR